MRPAANYRLAQSKRLDKSVLHREMKYSVVRLPEASLITFYLLTAFGAGFNVGIKMVIEIIYGAEVASFSDQKTCFGLV